MEIHTPLTPEIISQLKAGQEVYLTGCVYTARDQAHTRLVESLKKKKRLPINIKNAIFYYCGPTASAHGNVIGSCGPTTSRRMDAFTPALLSAGLIGMIGKGGRSPEVVASIKKNRAVYFLTYAGCGALVATYVKRARLVAFPELGPEAILELYVKELPLIVAVDSRGRSVYP